MKWLVKRFDCNKQEIVDYDVLEYKKDFLNKLRKESRTKEDFSEKLKREMMYQYWSRAEHEIVVEKRDDKIILSPWVGCRNPSEAEIDVTNDKSFNWKSFAEKHIGQQIFKDKAKIDIYDQLEWNWDNFVTYCWKTKN